MSVSVGDVLMYGKYSKLDEVLGLGHAHFRDTSCNQYLSSIPQYFKVTNCNEGNSLVVRNPSIKKWYEIWR